MFVLNRDYKIEDRQAVEILLSAQVICPRTPAMWMVIETNWYSRQTEDAWFAFGTAVWTPWSFPGLRVFRPWRQRYQILAEIFEDSEMERLFVESDWERFPHADRVPGALELLDRSLRIRCLTGRGTVPLMTLDFNELQRRRDLLSAATRMVLEDPAGDRPQNPPKFVAPPNLLYHAELLQRLCPWFRDWNVLLRNLSILAIRHAYLLGRDETNEEDWRLMARVAADSIPPWVRKATEALLIEPTSPQRIQRLMNLYEATKRSGHGAYAETRRLAKGDLIHYRNRGNCWEINEKHRRTIDLLLNQKAFAPQPILQTASQ